MKVLQGLGQAPDDMLTIFLKSTMIRLVLQVAIERNPIEILHDDIEVVVSLYHVEDLNYAGMV